MRPRFVLCLTALWLALSTLPVTAAPDWVTRSDENADVLIGVLARFAPEQAGFFGIEGLDEEVSSLPLDLNQQVETELTAAIAELRERLETEEDPAVRQDLEILIASAEDNIASQRINDRHLLPYFDLHQTVFQGIRTLLDDQVEESRRAAAVTRLRRYAGLEEGYVPITEQAMAYTRAKFDQALLGPYQGEIDRNLGNAPRFVAGIEQLFQKYELTGWEEAYAALKDQLAAYETFVREEIQPRAREDFRLPEEVYSDNLKNVGVDMPVDELVSRAKVAFKEIQNEMQAIAGLIAAERDLPSSDYRDVIRELKKEQLVGEAILPHYQQRIAQLEEIIEEEGILTLPERDMRIRLASEAESAAIPAPNMRPPRMIGNTGEIGEFVLPLRIPGEDGSEEVGFDDFTFEAASWTLTVHEGRSGHELQFASIVEKGVSKARVLFAFNSVNVEGWALYQEAELKPYMPLDGQLISLQHRLLRAARAFLDPSLQLGKIDQEAAYRVLEDEVVMSHPMAMQEVERYTFWAPAQATAYFCGYQRWMEIRADAERILGDDFDRRAYHDFLLAQGLLPPRLVRKAVMEEFVPSQRG